MAKTPPKKKEPAVKQEKKPAKPEEPEKEGFRGIVRIAGKDIKGQVPLRRALMNVRGIGQSLAVPIASVLSSELGIAPDTKVGELDDAKIEKIDAILFNLHNYPAIPKFMLNRKADRLEGSDKHVIMNDLLFAVREDVESEKKLYTWKGYRHSYGQKVRGQKTRNTGRTGMAVGVLRKAIIAQQAAAAKPGEAAGAGKPSAAAPGIAAKPTEVKGAPAAKGAPVAKTAAPAAAKPAGKPAEKK
jgi:small subunit ribosomal protein S13